MTVRAVCVNRIMPVNRWPPKIAPGWKCIRQEMGKKGENLVGFGVLYARNYCGSVKLAHNLDILSGVGWQWKADLIECCDVFECDANAQHAAH